MIHSDVELIEFIQEVGFLPLLDSGIAGFSAEELVDEDCRYVTFPDGGWEWPLWKWKGPVVTEGNCVYGKFFNGKAGFISQHWWPHFRNYRRSQHPLPEQDTIEDIILQTLREQGSMITRELRAACGFTGPKMRSRFDGYITRLQMATYIITEDFVYPRDKHNRPYGWGWSLLTTPEQLYAHNLLLSSPSPFPSPSHSDFSPFDSLHLILDHLHHILPSATEAQILKLVR